MKGDNVKISILYIGIGKYILFWEEFYKSCEKNFLPGVEKEYFVFSDSKEEIYGNKNKIKMIEQEDLGWPGNTLFRFKMFSKIKKELKKNDYIFFFNSNYVFLNPINALEVIPIEKNDYLTCLSWHVYKFKDREDFPYDRNENSKSYISYEDGEIYYQGGFNGGRTEEYLKLIEECNKNVALDLADNIVAKVHDESHLNKYLLDKTPKILSTGYGKPEEWDYSGKIKAILRRKENTLSEEYYKKLKKIKKINFLKKVIIKLFKKKEKMWNKLQILKKKLNICRREV